MRTLEQNFPMQRRPGQEIQKEEYFRYHGLGQNVYSIKLPVLWEFQENCLLRSLMAGMY